MRRNAALFVLISLLSGFGSTAMTLAAGLWILELTGSVGLAALIGVCVYAPTFAGPWLGALVDRLPRRPTLIWVDVLLGVTLLSLLTVHSAAGVGLIYGFLLMRGVGYVLLDAGETAILPAALPPSALGEVNGWRSSAQEGMKLVAPLAGAGLFAWHGPVPVVLVSATMPLLTAACYALLRVNPVNRSLNSPERSRRAERERGEGAERERGVRAGVRVLLGQQAVGVPVVVAGVAIAMSGLTNAAVLARIVHGLHLPAAYLGYLGSAQGAGSIVGGLLVGRLLARWSPARVAAVGAALFAAGCTAQCLPWWPAMIVGSVLIGIGLPWTLIAGVTAVQTGTPDRLLGRVAATANLVMFGPVAATIPLGAALVQFGARPLLVTAAVLATAAALWHPAASALKAGHAAAGHSASAFELGQPAAAAEAGNHASAPEAGRAAAVAEAGHPVPAPEAGHPAAVAEAGHPASAPEAGQPEAPAEGERTGTAAKAGQPAAAAEAGLPTVR